jgi:hypothetical protein
MGFQNNRLIARFGTQQRKPANACELCPTSEYRQTSIFASYTPGAAFVFKKCFLALALPCFAYLSGMLQATCPARFNPSPDSWFWTEAVEVPAPPLRDKKGI